MKNIVLIGMPGSGKSTLLRLLADRLKRPAIDTDLYIVEKQGKSIQQLFDVSEEYFRDIETEAYRRLSSLDGRIIATGGGAVKRRENIEYLRRNGVIVLLDRSCENIIKDIDTSGRPLLKEGTERIYKLYRERKDLYFSSADFVADNNGSLQSTLKAIVKYCTEAEN